MDSLRKRLIIIMILAVFLFAGSFYSYWQKNSVVETAYSLSPVMQGIADKNNDVVIYVSGAVNHPGVFNIKNGSRIIDAINQAGGLATGADCSNLNLAQEVKDGMQIKVTADVTTQQEPENKSSREPGRISINTADKNELDKLPGVGPALAERIIEYRKNNGPFREVTDLKKVSGIGEAKYKHIQDKISL